MTGRAGSGRNVPRFNGFEGAVARFLKIYPGGFGSPSYWAHERRGKERAHREMAELLPAVMAGGGADLGTRIARIVARTGHLHPTQMMRLTDLLGSSSGVRFMQAAAHFADGDRQAFTTMTALLDHAGATGWTAATVLPFLWRPDLHMLLKPESTRNFARWAGHPFAATYASQRELKVYDGLLEFAATTRDEIGQLRPVDQIDVQGFIWVTARYDRDDERPAPSIRRQAGTGPHLASLAPD